MISISLSISF